MARNTLPDWEKYWANFVDLELLRHKANNLDETLQLIEKEFETKLLSGDHLQLLDALEERIEQLEKDASAQQAAVQTSLFDDF